MTTASISTLVIPQPKGRRQRAEESFGTAGEDRKYDPLPKDWRRLAAEIQEGTLPENFAEVPGGDGRFTRSELVLPPHIKALKKKAQGEVLHIITFQDSAEQYEELDDEQVQVHHIEINSASFFKDSGRVNQLVHYIMQLEGHVHFHCLRGQVRTGLVAASLMRKFGKNILQICGHYWKHSQKTVWKRNIGNLSGMVGLAKLAARKPETIGAHHQAPQTT